MKINFIDKIKYMLRTKNQETLLQEGIDHVQKSIEKADDEEAVKKGAEAAYKYFEDSTRNMTKEQKGEFVQEYANLLVKRKGIPYDVAVEYINAMIKEDEIANEYILDPARDLPDSKITKLTQKPNIPIDDRKELIDLIEDEKIRQEQEKKLEQEEKRIIDMKKRRAIDVLTKIYNTCNNEENDYELSEKINEALMSENAKYLSDEEIEEIKAKIVAKRIAYNMNRFAGTPLSYLSRILSVKDMKRLGIVNMATEEYEKIEEKNREFDKETLLKNIEKIGKEDKAREEKDTEKDEFQRIKYGLLKLPPEKRKAVTKHINDYISSQINQISTERPNSSKEDDEQIGK